MRVCLLCPKPDGVNDLSNWVVLGRLKYPPDINKTLFTKNTNHQGSLWLGLCDTQALFAVCYHLGSVHNVNSLLCGNGNLMRSLVWLHEEITGNAAVLTYLTGEGDLVGVVLHCRWSPGENHWWLCDVLSTEPWNTCKGWKQDKKKSRMNLQATNTFITQNQIVL